MSERDAIAMMSRCHHKLGERAAELVARAQTGDDVGELLDFFEKVTVRHFADEEQSIFPRLGAAQAELVEQLTAEHRVHEALLAELRDIATAAGDLVPLAKRWRRELMAHAQTEDDQLMPLLQAMPGPTRNEITAEMKARRGRGGGDHEGRRGGGGGGGRRRP